MSLLNFLRNKKTLSHFLETDPEPFPSSLLRANIKESNFDYTEFNNNEPLEAMKGANKTQVVAMNLAQQTKGGKPLKIRHELDAINTDTKFIIFKLRVKVSQINSKPMKVSLFIPK